MKITLNCHSILDSRCVRAFSLALIAATLAVAFLQTSTAQDNVTVLDSAEPTATAQAAPIVPAAAPPPVESSVSIIEMFKLGGWTMYPLLLCSAGFFGFSIYNALTIRTDKLVQPAVMTSARQGLANFEISRTIESLQSTNGLAPEILLAGLQRIGRFVSVESVESGMEEAVGEQVNSYGSTINYLSVIGVIAPMIGLLGTVSGMIKAFRSMAIGGMGRPELLADNISEALITTAAGLVVGIPSMAAYFFFKYRFAKILATSTRRCGDALDALRIAAQERMEPPAPPSPSSDEAPAEPVAA